MAGGSYLSACVPGAVMRRERSSESCSFLSPPRANGTQRRLPSAAVKTAACCWIGWPPSTSSSMTVQTTPSASVRVRKMTSEIGNLVGPTGWKCSYITRTSRVRLLPIRFEVPLERPCGAGGRGRHVVRGMLLVESANALLQRTPLPQPIRLQRQIAVVECPGEPPHKRAE